MQLDTGAAVSLISIATYQSLWPPGQPPHLHQSSIKLRTYTGEEPPVKGTIRVSVQYKDQKAELPLMVVGGNGTSLLGRDWLLKLRLDWPNLGVNEVRPTADTSLSSILDSNAEVFKDELGLVKETAAKLYVDASVQPRSCQAWSVPYALRCQTNCVGPALSHTPLQILHTNLISTYEKELVQTYPVLRLYTGKAAEERAQ